MTLKAHFALILSAFILIFLLFPLRHSVSARDTSVLITLFPSLFLKDAKVPDQPIRRRSLQCSIFSADRV